MCIRDSFRALYYPARCLVHNSDLYLVSDVLPVYQSDSSHFPLDNWKNREIATRNVYPPTAFTFMLPFAMFSWGPAHILWLILTPVSYTHLDVYKRQAQSWVTGQDEDRAL